MPGAVSDQWWVVVFRHKGREVWQTRVRAPNSLVAGDAARAMLPTLVFDEVTVLFKFENGRIVPAEREDS